MDGEKDGRAGKGLVGRLTGKEEEKERVFWEDAGRRDGEGGENASG